MRANVPTPPLRGLEEIPWATLSHAHGSAEDVPLLLQGLLDADEVVRSGALDELYDKICHQGSVYDASVPATFFLLRLLGSPDTPDPGEIMGLLAALGQGSSYLAVHADTPQQQAMWRRIFSEDGREFEQELRRELDSVAAIRENLKKNAALLREKLSMLEDNEEIEAFESILDTLEEGE